MTCVCTSRLIRALCFADPRTSGSIRSVAWLGGRHPPIRAVGIKGTHTLFLEKPRRFRSLS